MISGAGFVTIYTMHGCEGSWDKKCRMTNHFVINQAVMFTGLPDLSAKLLAMIAFLSAALPLTSVHAFAPICANLRLSLRLSLRLNLRLSLRLNLRLNLRLIYPQACALIYPQICALTIHHLRLKYPPFAP